MLTKKLKKIRKECRAADDPVLLSVATYLDHVVNYLKHPRNGDARWKEFGIALSQVDLSAVAKAREAFTADLPGAGEEDDEPRSEEFVDAKTRKRKKTKKEK